MTSEPILTTTSQNLLSTNVYSSSIHVSSTKASDSHTSSRSSTVPGASTSSEFPSFSTSTSGSLSFAGIGLSTSAGILSTTGHSSKDHGDQLPYFIMILFVVLFGTCVFCLCALALRKYKRNRSRYQENIINKVNPQTSLYAKDVECRDLSNDNAENCLHETGQVLVTRGTYDEIDMDLEVIFTSPLNRNEGKEIKDVKQYDGGCDVDNSPYAECPENVYDKMFTARPHVNKVPENVYQSVEVGNSRYSMVKPISNHTS